MPGGCGEEKGVTGPQFEEILEAIDTNCASFLEAISEGVHLLDEKGYFLYVNKAIEKRAGIAAETFVGMHYLDIVEPEDREGLRQVFDRVMRGEHVAPHEASYRTAAGNVRHVELSSRPLFQGEQVVGVLGISRDITRKKQVESVLKKANLDLEARVKERARQIARANRALEAERDSLRQSEETIRALLNAVTEVMFLVSADGVILALNDTAAERFGKSAQEAVGMNLKELLEPEILEDRKSRAAPALRDGTPVLFEDQRQDRTFRTSVYPIKDGSGEVVRLAVFGTDITAYKKAEEELLTHQNNLRSLASQLSLAEERQRRRIAVEVHDHVGQNLAFAKMRLAELGRQTSVQDVSELAEEVSALIEGAIQDTRALVSELGSPVLYELGFVPAVAGLCKEIEKGHGLRVRYQDDKKPKPLADDVQVLLFQSLREVLANALKHARATKVEVSLSVKEEFLEIVVCDDGVGFDRGGLQGMIQEGQNFGLFSIQQRLESVAGNMNIDSVPGRGTCVTLMAPLTTASVLNGNRKREEREGP